MMPKRLWLLRHADAAVYEDEMPNLPEFKATHRSKWPLKPGAEEHCKRVGQYLLTQVSFAEIPFQRYYASPYSCTALSAALLDLPEAQWDFPLYLRARSRGDADSQPPVRGIENSNNRAPNLFSPERADAEAVAEMIDRGVGEFLSRLADDCSNCLDVLAVMHREMILGIRARIEGWSVAELWAAIQNKGPQGNLPCNAFVQYSRIVPKVFEQEAGTEHKKFRFVRVYDPIQDQKIQPWERFSRRKLSNEDVLKMFEPATS